MPLQAGWNDWGNVQNMHNMAEIMTDEDAEIEINFTYRDQVSMRASHGFGQGYGYNNNYAYPPPRGPYPYYSPPAQQWGASPAPIPPQHLAPPVQSRPPVMYRNSR